MRERRLRTHDEEARFEQLEIRVEADAAQRDHDVHLRQSLDFGREVHGHAKHPTPQPVDISFSTPPWCRFDVSCDGKRVVFGRMRCPEEAAETQRISFGFVTPKEVFQTRNIIHFEMEGRYRLVGEGDEFSISSDSALGRELAEMRFTPQVVQYLPNIKFVMPKPLNWRGPKEQK